ncbi:MAG: HNH endonuclease, partial [Cellulophaga fucicola]
SKAVLVQINEDGNYKIVKNDGSILKSGKTEVIKCSFVNNKDTSVNESLIAQGLSEDKIIIELSEGINQTDSRYDDIIKLSKYVKSIIKESKWSFLYKQTSGKNKYPKNYGRDLLIMVLKEKKIFTIADFDDNFRYFKYEKDDPYYIQDIDVLISNFDPWEGIPEEYNRHTFDYTSFNVPDLNNKEIIVSQINIIEDLFTSISKNYPNYFTEKQKLKFIDYIDNRRSTEGINSILNHRLSERKNMIAAYQALGAFDKYHYSIKDFKVREFLESTGNFIGEIKKNEASGVATPIHISESYDQYVAKHNSNSAFFYGVEYLKMYGDLLEFEVLGNAVVKAQKALSKNFKKFNIPTNNADLTISTTAVKNKMSGFNKIASESSQTVKSNIRTLRKWAKSKGYTKKAGSGSNSDTPEVWGTSNNGKFTEKLKLDGSSGEIKITATTIEGKPLKVKLSDGSEVNATAMPLTSKIDNFVYLTNNIPLSLSNKLGKKVTELENWLLKYSNDIGEDATKLLTNLKDNIGNKQILEVLEDGQKRLTVVTKGDGITNDVISLQKNVNGRYTNVTYNRAYNPTANMEIDVALSKNKLTPDYTKTQLGSISTKYLYPKNLLPSGKLPVVKIKMSGKRKGTGGDFDLANQAIGMKAEWGIEAPRGYVWHHMDDFNPNTGECTMQLVKSNAHTRVKGMAHSGSVAQYKAYYINTENTSNGLFYNN